MAKTNAFRENYDDNFDMNATEKKKLMKLVEQYGDWRADVISYEAHREVGFGLQGREAQAQVDRLYRKIEALLNK